MGSGLVGLGFTGLQQSNTTLFLDNLVIANIIDDKSF